MTEDLSDLKIIDFNASVSLNNRNYTRGRTGEIEFQPLEMLHGEKYCSKVDIWSAGIILF